MSQADWIDRAEYPFDSHHIKVAAGSLHYVDEGSGLPVVMVHGNPTWSYPYRHLSYAVAHPENVARIVIMNTWAWPVNRDPYYIAFSGFVGGPIGRLLIRRYNFFARSIMRQAFGDKRKLTAAAHEHYLRALATPEDRTGCYVFPRQIIKSTPWLSELWENVSRLNGKPTLIIWGMKDIAFREKELKRWEGVFPEARTIRLSSVGHFVQEEAPDELAEAVVPFLNETAVESQ